MTQKLILRYHPVGGVLKRRGQADIIPGGGGPGPGPVQPTGSGIVRIQDISISGQTYNGIVPGDSGSGGLTLTQALHASGLGNVKVSFPPGVFEMKDFADSGKYGCQPPSNIKGLLGSGIAYTTLQLKAGSSTKVGSIPSSGTNPLYIFRTAANPTGGFDVQGIRWNGTDQPVSSATNRPHDYGGLMFDHITTTPPTMTDVKFQGIPGSDNSPVGETFQFNDFGCTAGVYTRIESDGRRATDGKRVSASPFGCNDSVNVKVIDGNFHHSLTSMPTFWQTNGVETHNLISYKNGTGSGGLRSQGINHERVTGRVRHYFPTITIDRAGGNTGLHVMVGNDQANDTDIQFIGATFDATAFFHNCLSLQMGDNYLGSTNLQKTLPKFYKADGVTLWTYYDGNSLGGVTFPDPANSIIRYH